jgi:hypothetical protein
MGSHVARFKVLPTIIAAFLLGSPAWAAVEVSGKHAVFIYPSLDQVLGNYVFLVRNVDSAPQPAEIPLMLPKETVDWRAEQGIDASDVEAVDKKLIIRKSFPPGETFIAIGFIVGAGMGEAMMTFDAPSDIDELAIYSRGGLEMTPESPLFKKGEPVEFSGNTYQTLSASGIRAAQSVSVKLTGLPKGRKEYWILGGAFMGFLTLVGGVAAWRTKPQIKETGDFA